ncbi:MAG: class I SAM-dependent methyltransferase [Candidatus Altimarinota bacterium]
METYNTFLEYYDKIVRGINSPLDEEVGFLHELIQKYNSKSSKDISILETACGTGVVAKEFQKIGYNITGLDINEKMLEKAKENLDEKHLILGDMTNFDLQKNFDVVLCNYNSICHLLTWQEWQKFFEMAYKHLSPNGLLIFDINTLFEFENITREFAQFYNFGDDSVCLEMFKKDGVYEWLIKIFKKAPDGRYDLITENVQENSFPIHMIKKELKNRGFHIEDLLDFHYGEVNLESERVYFVATKK